MDNADILLPQRSSHGYQDADNRLYPYSYEINKTSGDTRTYLWLDTYSDNLMIFLTEYPVKWLGIKDKRLNWV